MKYIKSLTLLIVLLLNVVSVSPAQKKIVHGESKQVTVADIGKDLVDIPELGVFITQNGDRLMVTNLMDAGSRPKGYEDIDIQLEDIVMMANAKRLSSLNDLQTLYKEASPGTTIKLGIKRGDNMMIVSFDKIDPSKLPKRKLMIRTEGGEDAITIPEVGLIIGPKEKHIVITAVLDNAKEALPDTDVKDGDRILNLNGEPCTSFKNFSAKYKKLAVGENVELVLSREGKNRNVSFKKPEDKGGMRIIRKTIGK